VSATPERLRSTSRTTAATRERAALRETVVAVIEQAVRNGASIRDAAAVAAAQLGATCRRLGVGHSAKHMERLFRRARSLSPAERRASLLHGNAVRPPAKKRFTVEDPFFVLLQNDYLPLRSEPALFKSYDYARDAAREMGIAEPYPSLRTVQRLLRLVNPQWYAFHRRGPKAERDTMPYQQRDRSDLKPMEIVTADGHACDFWVQFPNGKVCRPELVVAADEATGKALSYAVDFTENARVVRECLCAAIEKYGKPWRLAFDNGSGFIEKQLNSGWGKKYRGRQFAGDPDGTLQHLGIEVRHFTPGIPRAKRQERTFGEIEGWLRADPALHRAWSGNAPDTKPERAPGFVTRDVFLAALERAVKKTNESPSRGANCNGLSRAAAFDATFDGNPFRRADEEELERLLRLRKVVVPDRKNYGVRLFGNFYYSPAVADAIRQATTSRRRKVLAYFDATEGGLHNAGVIVYSVSGKLLGRMPCVEKPSYNDVEAATRGARVMADVRRKRRDYGATLAAAREQLPDAVIARRPDIAPPAPAPSAPQLNLEAVAERGRRVAAQRGADSHATPYKRPPAASLDLQSGAARAARVAAARSGRAVLPLVRKKA